MNKIYRVVWNETTQTWNAVAEFAKAHGKTASSGIGGIIASAGVRFAFTAIMSGLLLASGQAVAAENNGKTLFNGTAVSAATEGTDYNTCYFDTTSYNIVCGDNSTTALDYIPQEGGQAAKQGKSIAIGQSAQTQGESNVAIGPNTRTSETGSIAIGSSSNASKNQSIAIGQGAVAKGQADIIIGKGAGPGSSSTNGRNIAIGENTLQNSTNSDNVIAIGTGAGTGSNSTQSIYMGNDATGTGTQNIVLGYKSVSQADNGVVIGATAKAGAKLSVAIGANSSAAGGNAVALGGNTDAAGASAVAIGGGTGASTGAKAAGASAIALGSNANAVGQRAIAIGEVALSQGPYSTAMGGKAQAVGTSSIAIGSTQNMSPTVAQGHYSIAIGHQAQALGGVGAQNTIAIGSSSTAAKIRAIAIGLESMASDENTLAVGYQANAAAKGATALGMGTQATAMSSIAIGKESIASAETATSFGQNSKATANNAVAIGNKAVAAGTGNIVVGTNAGVYDDAVSAGRTVGADTVYIGADSGRNAYSNERQISIGKGTGNNATGVDNIALGWRSGAFVSGANNVAIGKEAGMGTDAQKLNVASTVAIGEAAKGSFSNTVAIGKTALAEKESAVAVGMDTRASGDNSVAIGKTANASAHETVAIGHETVAGAVSSVAVGQRANASGSEAVALGIDSNASGRFAVAIGNMAKVTDSKLNGVAIGSNAVASDDYAMAMGLDTQATGNSSIAFGNTAKALGKEAIAFGHLATAAKNNTLALGVSANSAEVGAVTLGAYTKADAVTGTALGYSAHAVNENDVALGGNSVTEAHHDGDYTLNGNYTAAGTSSYGTVSVGSINTAEAGKPSNAFTRQIQNVSAGVISATSTDAVNGSQLYATNSYLLNLGKNVKNALGGDTQIDNEGNLTLSNLGGTGTANVHDALEAMNNKITQLGGNSSHFYSVQTTSNTRGNYNNDGATGLDALAAGADAQAAGEFAVAVGTGAQAAISNSIAIGRNATVNEDTVSDASVNGLTKGEGSVAIGANTKASGTNATAVGQSSNAYGQNSFAGGQSSKALGKSSVAVGDGAQAIHDSATAVGPYSQATAAGATALGFNTRATASGTVAAGRNSKAASNNALALGNEADAQKDDTIAIGYNAQATQNRAVAFGKNAQATAGDTFALGDSAKASVGNAIAFGKNANAAHKDSIALGANSATEAAVQTTSATVGGLTFGNFAGTAPESTLSIGTAGKERTITNVAAGRISDSSTDAINGSQLYATQNVMNNIGTSAVGVLGGDAAIANNGTITMTDIGGTGKDNVHDAIKSVKETAEKGWNLKANDETSSEKIAAGDTVTVKQGKNIRVKRSGKELTVETSDDVEFGTVSATTVLADSFISGNSVLSGEGLKIGADGSPSQVSLTNAGLNNGGNKISNVATGEADTDAVNVAQLKSAAAKATSKVDSGNDNIVVTPEQNADGSITYKVATAPNLKADSLTAGETVVNNSGVTVGDKVALSKDGLKAGDVNITADGIDAGNKAISNVAKGVKATDAVNVAQLNEQLAATEKTTTVVAGKNVTVSEKVDGNNTEYTVNADKTTLSQAANGAIKVSEGAKDADGVTDYALDLTDEAKADIAKGVAAKDAVDNKGLTFAADNGTTGAKKLGDSLSVKGDGNILTRADENGIGFSLADKITVGKAGKGNKPLVIDGTAGLISGLSNTTLGGADFATKGQAASEEQLNATQANLANLLGGNAANDKGNVTTTDIGGTGKDNVHDAIAAVKETADKGWNLNANDETSSEKIGAGDTVTFKEGKNVKVSRNGKNITVATSDDVSFDKVTVGGSVLTDNGLTVGNGKAGKPVSLTKDGLNNGGNKVSDIAAGEADTDAVNVAQLKAAAAKATSKVDSGNDNIVVTPEQNADGSTTYKVATAPNLKADSFTAGDTVVNNDGVKVGDKVALGKDGLKAGDVNITADGINAGNKAISNVAAGVKDTDAANVGQLNRLTAAAKTEVEAGTNIASVSSKQGANGQTVYTVNADGASVSAGSDNIVVTKGKKDADNVTDYAVDLSKAVKADIAKGVAAKDAVDNKGISFAGDSGTTVANKLGDTVAVKGDANITTTAGANGIQVGLNKDLKVDSVKAGDTVVNNNGVNVGDKVALGKDGLKAGDVNITADGINAGGKKVTGVAAGTVAAGSTDAVNGGQLHQVYELIGSNGGNVNTAPPSVEADGKAGLGNIKNITLVDNSNNPNVTNVTNETKIAQSNGYSLVTYNVEDQGMYVTNNVIEAVGRMNEQGIKFFHTNDGEVNPDVQAHNGEDSSASGAYATAVGYQAASKGTNAIAIGKGAKANAENTIAIGTGNIVSGKNSGAIGDPTVVSGNSSYSIGNNNNVSADNAYALGSNIKATVKDSVYLGDRAQTQGIHTADAAKGEAYTYGGLNDKAVAGKAGSTAAANKVAGVVTVGNGTDETRQVQGVAAGVVSADSTDAINGSQLYYTNQAIANVATQATAAKTEVTAGKNVVVNQTTGNSGQTVYNVATADKLDVTSVTAGGVTVNAQGVSIAAPTANNPSNTVSLSPIGLNNGGQRITNVAPAKEGTDAVNLNQLAGMGNALQNNIERVGKKAYAGVAGAIAQGSIPQVTRPGATGIGVGSGYYGGQSAMAIGVSAMSDGGNWVVKGNFSANTDGHVGVGAGALYQW